MTTVARRYATVPAPSSAPARTQTTSCGHRWCSWSRAAPTRRPCWCWPRPPRSTSTTAGAAARIARERLHVLHVNHQLRGIDAEEDEEFVRDLAARYGIPCTIRRADVAALAARSGDNVENAGRQIRYAAANQLANELSAEMGTPRSAARILTAHTANDRAETFFMNAIRGTGTAGLSSIPRRRNRIVRPLLGRTHEELCDILRMRGIVWREDDTNADTRYLRAYVRHEVMPKVLARNPRAMASLSTTCDILSDEDSYLNQVASRTYRDLTRRTSETMVALDARRLAACEVAIARRVVRKAILDVCPEARLEARHVARVLELVARGRGSTSVPMGVDARVDYGMLFVRARSLGSRSRRAGSRCRARWPSGDGQCVSRPAYRGAGGLAGTRGRAAARAGVRGAVGAARRGGVRARPRAGGQALGRQRAAWRRDVSAGHARAVEEAVRPPGGGRRPRCREAIWCPWCARGRRAAWCGLREFGPMSAFGLRRTRGCC